MKTSRGNLLPVYLRVRDHFVAQIHAGALEPHNRLPSERELSQELHISRMTARQAFVQLEAEGFIYRSNRRGWFVSPPRLRYNISRSASFADNVITEGGRPRTKVLSARAVVAPTWARERLDLRAGTRVYAVRRLRLIGAQPAMLEDTHIVATRCPGLLKHDLSRSFREIWKQEYGINLLHSAVTIELTHLDERLARHLGVESGAAGLLVTQTLTDQNNQLFYAERQHWRGDVAEFSFEVAPGGAV